MKVAKHNISKTNQWNPIYTRYKQSIPEYICVHQVKEERNDNLEYRAREMKN